MLQRIRHTMRESNGFAAVLAAIFIVLLSVIMCGCKSTKTVTMERVRVDSVYITKEQRDSIYMHDSIYVREYARAESAFIEIQKLHTVYRDRTRTDTILQTRIDSIPVPYEVVKEVAKPLRWWQKTLMYLGVISIIGLIIYIKR